MSGPTVVEAPELTDFLETMRAQFMMHYGRTHHTRYRIDWPPEGRPVIVRQEILAPAEVEALTPMVPVIS